MGSLKFNVDRSPISKPGPAGIDGVMRNHERVILLRFSKSIGVKDSNMTELLSIKEAMLVFVSSAWVQNHSLCVKNDSMNAISWVTNPRLAP